MRVVSCFLKRRTRRLNWKRIVILKRSYRRNNLFLTKDWSTGMKNDPNYFPVNMKDLDESRGHCIMSDDLGDPGHPGFNDPVYRERRNYIARVARDFKIGDTIPKVQYTEPETKTWSYIFDRLINLYPTHACKQYNEIFPNLSKECGMTRNNIPQLADISDFLKERTGFTLVPVQGLLAPRYFLNALAFRVFNSTQYLRHHSVPDYTPEPDIVHELMGHVPLLADPDFADFTQALGLASLGATEDDINRLSRVYWFTVEFGLVRQDELPKAVGSGLLSSFGELQYCLSDKPQVKEFEPTSAAEQEYPITKYQPLYFIANSFEDMKKKIEKFSKYDLKRPFGVRFDKKTWTVSKILPKEKKNVI